MNEQIQELAVKAKLMAEEDINKQISYNAELQAFAEKFAELIVRECMKVADEGMAQVTMRVEWPSYHIKKHFGVEE